ncbi:MAG: VanZ family protein [Clostridium sp.]
MSVFTEPITVSTVLFPIVFIITIIPYIIYMSIKYKNISKFKAFIIYSFIFYCMTAFLLTMLPFPEVDKQVYNQTSQLIPFNFIRDIIKEANIDAFNAKAVFGVITGRAFLQVFFNILLTIPLGIYIRYLFKKDIKTTFLICFLASLFVEVTQLTGIFGLYEYPYRLFDVDDLMLNTLGGGIGFYIEPIFMFVLPNLSELDNKYEQFDKLASFTKRGIAFALDCFLFNVLFINDNTGFLGYIILAFTYFVVIPYITQGITFGGFVMGIRIKSLKGKLDLISLTKRYGILIYLFFGINKFLSAISNNLAENDINIFLAFMFIQFVFNFICIIHVISHIRKKDRILIFDKLSNTYIVGK